MICLKIHKFQKNETEFPLSLQGISSIINSNQIYYERLPMLEVIFDRLVRLLSTSLRNFTSENVIISLDSISSVRFGDYVDSFQAPCLINVFIVKEWENHGLMMMDNDLIYVFIDILLGGRKGVAPIRSDNRQFTTIECNLIARAMGLFLEALSAAFEPVCAVSFLHERLETNPTFAAIARPANTVVLVRLSVDIDSRGGIVEVLLPLATLEPIRDLLLQNFMGEKFGRDSIWEDHLANQLMETDVELSALLDSFCLPLSEVLEWKIGSHIDLKATPESFVILTCGNNNLFKGKMGHKSGKIAIQIEEGILKEKELDA